MYKEPLLAYFIVAWSLAICVIAVALTKAYLKRQDEANVQPSGKQKANAISQRSQEDLEMSTVTVEHF